MSPGLSTSTTDPCAGRIPAFGAGHPAGFEGRDAGGGQGQDRSSSGRCQRLHRSDLQHWWTHNPSFNNPFDNNTIGASVDIPLRIFDRNQGEKARTQLDIKRNERLHEATEAQVFSDVDSAYAMLNSNLTLLRPYKADVPARRPLRVRDTMSFAYQHGGASLLDFLNAQSDYRSIQVNYLNLVGAYLTAASQLNLAVGREAIQ